MLTRRQLMYRLPAVGLGASLLPAQAAILFRLAYFETYSPISFRDGSQMSGILVDIFDAVLKRRLGMTLDHEGYPWARAQTLVQSGEADAMCTVATQARLDYAQASRESVLTMPIRLFAPVDSPLLPKLATIRSMEELRQLNPSVLSYIGNGWAKEKLAGMRVDWGGTFAESVRKLIAGRGDVMVENVVSMQYTLRSMDGQQRVRMLSHTLESSDFHLLINRASPHVSALPAIDEALRKFKREPAYNKIFERYGIKL
ncbi:ABC transporter substrate-binding protein [Chitinimonas sp. BJYL2]|uniref:substrate-binding periplasmic protein n=1 Tax=Chitinimonas sp. BJYL2 TaxID=2976696 RepID=UPI0022B59607|nr:transporter substrate-binding domain-containing protein [Chitinimonas sp. BJYL2]